MTEADHAVGQVSRQRGIVLKTLMEEFGVVVNKHTGRGARSHAPMNLAAASEEVVAQRFQEDGLSALVARSRGGEDWASLVLRVLAMCGRLDSVLRCAPIARYVFEFNLGKHRADLVCWHTDGGVSIIEAKGGDGPATGVVAGVGQVTMYALMYLQQCDIPPVYLRKYVVAPVVASDQVALCVLTAVNCNVQFVALPGFEPFKSEVTAMGACIAGG